MHTLSSTDAQQRFGQMLDLVQREPVSIHKRGRRVAVVVSSERYEELEAIEDRLWAARAEEAAKRGFVSAEESADMLRSSLNADS